MRKSKAYLLVVCVLVVALLASLVIGCTPKSEGPKGGSSFSGGSVADPSEGATVIENADKYMQFELFAENDTNIDERVKVEDLAGNKIDAAVVSLSNGFFRVHAPNGGYVMYSTYLISLGDGVSFVDYPEARKIKFTVTVDTVSNIEFKGDTIVVSNELVTFEKKEGNDSKTGTEYGQIRVQNNGKFELFAGDVFVVDNKATGLQKAYKVKDIQDVGGIYLINYVKPELEEIYSSFTFQGTEVLDDDNKDQVAFYNEEEVADELANSEVAQIIAGVFGVAPKFNVDIKLEGKEVVAIVTVNVANVVYTDNSHADLIFKIENRLSATADSSISNDKVNNVYDLAFDVKANIKNKVTFNVGILASGAYSKVENIQGMIDKIQLDGMENVKNDEEIVEKIEAVDEMTKSAKDDVNVKLFKWTLPIANGAAAVSYDADLAFRFNFSGQFGVAAETTLNYVVGASYNVKDGIDAYVQADEDNKPCDKVNLVIDGKVDVRVGINQRVGLDVLAGVLGLGLRANVGNFNKLYGYADASWVAQKNAEGKFDMVGEKAFDGTMYLEGGIYWDVNIDLGIKVGELLNFDALNNVNVNKAFNISTGEKILYTGGNKEVVRNIVADCEYKGGKATISAKKAELSFNKYVYNVLSRKYENVALTADEVASVEVVNSKQVVVNKVNGKWIAVVATPEEDLSFDLKVTYNYIDAFKQPRVQEDVISYVYSGTLVLDKNAYVFNKSAANGSQDQVITVISKKGQPELLINGQALPVKKVTNNNNTYAITVDHKSLDVYANGNYTLTAKAGNEEVSASLVIDGRVSAKNYKNQQGYYEIYCLDQVVDLFSVTYDSKDIFLLVDSIDMKGAKLETLPEFKSTLRGNGNEIKNFVVKNSNSDNNNALVAVNNGEIDGVTFAGTVEVELYVNTNDTHYVAGVVAQNNGKLVNVNFNGKLVVNSNGLKTLSDVYVAGVVAKNNGTAEGCAVVADKDGKKSVIEVNYKFDLAGMEFFVESVDVNAVTVTGKCAAGAYNNLTKVHKA